MPKINKNLRIKQYKIPLALAVAGLSGIFLFRYLTFVPKYSNATEISTADPVTLPEIQGEITTKFGNEAQGYKTYMQEISLSYCQNLPNETTGQLADGRDGKIYWVTVLGTGDAKTCWMTQDLDYDLNGQALTTKNDGDNFLKGSDAEWSGRMTDGSLILSSSGGWTTANERTLNWFDRNSVHGTEHNSLGNLYSFQTVSANTGSVDTGIVPGSICPAGWKLPLSNSVVLGSFGSLQNIGMSSNTLANGSPYFFQYGGYIGSYLRDVGRNGHYWSASVLNSSIMYYLYFTVNGDFNPTDGGGYRHNGFAVRCVVRDASYVPPAMPSGSISTNPNISVTVPSIIILDVYSEDENDNVVDIAIDNNGSGIGQFTAKVSSNSAYNLSLSTIENGHTDLRNDNTNSSIPALNSTTNITESSSKWWGIKCTNTADSTNCKQTNYTGLTDYLTPTLFYTSTQGANSNLIHFTIGIQTSPDLPSGTYSTSILVTASQN